MRRRVYQLAVIIISLFVIQGFSRSLIELWQQKQRLARAKQDLIQLEQQKVELKKQLAYYQSDEYVEKIAREKLMLGKEGEEVVLLPQQQNDNNPINTNEKEINQSAPNWKKWARLFGW